MTDEELAELRIVTAHWRTKITDNLDAWFGDPEAWYALKYMRPLLAEVERLQTAHGVYAATVQHVTALEVTVDRLRAENERLRKDLEHCRE